jgi:hypothetical protein
MINNSYQKEPGLKASIKNQPTVIGVKDTYEMLMCSDIIFAILNDAFNRIEPIVYGFLGESKALNSDV